MNNRQDSWTNKDDNSENNIFPSLSKKVNPFSFFTFSSFISLFSTVYFSFLPFSSFTYSFVHPFIYSSTTPNNQSVSNPSHHLFNQSINQSVNHRSLIPPCVIRRGVEDVTSAECDRPTLCEWLSGTHTYTHATLIPRTGRSTAVALCRHHRWDVCDDVVGVGVAVGECVCLNAFDETLRRKERKRERRERREREGKRRKEKEKERRKREDEGHVHGVWSAHRGHRQPRVQRPPRGGKRRGGERDTSQDLWGGECECEKI